MYVGWFSFENARRASDRSKIVGFIFWNNMIVILKIGPRYVHVLNAFSVNWSHNQRWTKGEPFME